MNREQKLKINTLIAIINQIITVLSGFILPRLYLTSYGSDVNGLSSSITQFLSVVSLMELGIGAVVQSAFYKPLAFKDLQQVSKIVVSSERFFRKIATFFFVYVVILLFVYPNFIQSGFNWCFEASLILIISISSLSEYYFGMTYRLLLMSDQKAYITYGLQSICTIISFFISVLLMYLGFSIHIVKLAYAFVFLMRPIGQQIYVRKNYDIDKKIQITEEPIHQKWNGIAQHVAYFITNNTDTMVLSIFSNLGNVSVYSIYNMIVSGIKQFIMTLNLGIQALFGNMLANNEFHKLKKRFEIFEWNIHTIVVLLFSCCGVLITEFVSVYTYGIKDANYYQPFFGAILTLSQALYCIRLPYITIVNAAGHYKQTQMSAIIEMLLNVTISIMLVIRFGLVGVAIGTAVSLGYRTIYLAYYISKNIIYYPFTKVLKHLLVDLLSSFIIVVLTSAIELNEVNYLAWFLLAIKTFIVAFIVVLIINYFFYRKEIMRFFGRLIN